MTSRGCFFSGERPFCDYIVSGFHGIYSSNGSTWVFVVVTFATNHLIIVCLPSSKCRSLRPDTHRLPWTCTTDELSGFVPKRRAFTIGGEDKTQLGVVPILHMRDLMANG